MLKEKKGKCQAIRSRLKEALRLPSLPLYPHQGPWWPDWANWSVLSSNSSLNTSQSQMPVITFLCKEADQKKEKKKKKWVLLLFCLTWWRGNNWNKTVFLFYETSEGNSLRSWHFISSNHLRSKIFICIGSISSTHRHGCWHLLEPIVRWPAFNTQGGIWQEEAAPALLKDIFIFNLLKEKCECKCP